MKVVVVAADPATDAELVIEAEGLDESAGRAAALAQVPVDWKVVSIRTANPERDADA